ncbi:PLD nuclease N-terminal domain-containing protein [Tengunoibacter tsumagoiensis]|uniref:Cardiolipin synthase N-terminal domain-containing protein n=1 Tax=Tengunoibacter tsumagoiensis TaxID=2014871 RepID=A0A401ZVY3_9CHLR|nr:PLD nuclease N-terminal domain-containing protein [Tengunoibacter tsumagoiensis]GCE10942.1 hypothetical protein KTT_08010 [Tengunoibacter tsumagoiensis]
MLTAGIILVTLLSIVIGGIALAAMAFWVWMLIDCAQNKRITENERIMWLLIIFFVHIVGALIYFFVGRAKQRAPLPYSASVVGAVDPALYAQGYRMHQMPPQRGPERPPVEDEVQRQAYEQPQASYPEQRSE